jgi:glycerol uptake facilitator-like aquaporin
MEAATSARGRFEILTGSRPQESTIPSRGLMAYTAEGLGTFLLVFFICAVISVGNADVLQVDLAGLLVLLLFHHAGASVNYGNPARWLGPALASGGYANFWIFIAGPIAGALLAALGYQALVLARQPNTTSEVSQ